METKSPPMAQTLVKEASFKYLLVLQETESDKEIPGTLLADGHARESIITGEQ